MTCSPSDPRWEHLSEARWYSGHGRSGRLGSVTELDWYVRPGVARSAIRSEICTVAYPDGSQEHYQLLVSYRATGGGPGYLGELPAGHAYLTTADEADLLALAAALREGVGNETQDWWTNLRRPNDFPVPSRARVLGADQSNTSIVYDERAMLKLLRRIEEGRSLDVSMLDALGRSGVKQVAKLFGWVSAKEAVGQGQPIRFDLAMISAFAPDAVDGWDFVLAAAREGRDLDEELSQLGRALAAVHAGLADSFPTAKVSGDELADQLDARLARAVEEVPALAEMAPALRSIFAKLRSKRFRVQRIHGDLHLGQTLHTDEGWYLIDFEGEPLKSLAERELPDPVWRDVAGVLRSLSYANAHARNDDRWLAAQSASLLTGYWGRTPELPPDDQLLLDAYTADKAIYEARYETRNRPDWVDIPLSALRRIITRRPG